MFVRGHMTEFAGLTGLDLRRYLWTDALMRYVPLAKTIEQFWMDDTNRKAGTWVQNAEINMVMLATSLAPGEFPAV